MAGKDVAVVSNSSGLLARFEKGDNPFLNDAGADEFFGAFLKFSGNTGDYNYGDDYAEEVPHGSELLLNMETALHGWICWVDGEVVDEENVLIASGKSIPKESDLENHGPYATNSDGTQDGWSEQYVFHFYWEKEDLAFTLKLASKSGIRAAKQLVRTYGKSYGVKIGSDGDVQVPVVEIGSTSFDVKKEDGSINKKAGKKHAPVLKIVDWADRSEVADFFESVNGDNGDDAEGYEDGDDDHEDKSTSARGSSRREEPPKEERSSGRGRAAAKDDDEDTGSSRGGRGRGRAAAEDDEDKTASSGRGRGGRGRAAAQDDDGADQDDDAVESEAPAEEARGGGRRARVVHAEPQDDDDAGEARDNPRESARGRRGRTR